MDFYFQEAYYPQIEHSQWKVLSLQQMWGKLITQVQNIAETMNTDKELCMVLLGTGSLGHKKWHKEIFQQKFLLKREFIIIQYSRICLGPITQYIKMCHLFCRNCLVDYITYSIYNKREFIKCPMNHCNKFIMPSIISQLSEKMYEKNKIFICKSYIQNNSEIKWCIQQNCQNAIYNQSYHQIVKCICGAYMCFWCHTQDHRPNSCQERKKWQIQVNTSQSDWIKSNAKACPKCKSFIQKNKGCNHIICTNCKYQFCWICSNDWNLHNKQTGGYYKCNRIDDKKLKKQNQTKSQLELYLFYLQRFKEHMRSQKICKETKVKKQQDIQKMIEIYKMDLTNFKFLNQAINIIIEGRKILKWTAVFMFNKKKKKHHINQLFEEHLGYFQFYLQLLQQLIESNIIERREKFNYYKEQVLLKKDQTEKFMKLLRQMIN